MLDLLDFRIFGFSLDVFHPWNTLDAVCGIYRNNETSCNYTLPFKSFS